MAQDEEALAEMETAVADPDPLVAEVATLVSLQIYRFRAMRLAELDRAHEAVQRVAALPHRGAVPVLIDVLTQPRTGYVEGDAGPVETDNARSRMVALLRLVEWHTADAQAAIRNLRFDRDPHLVKAAEKALDLFPGDWKGPLKAP